MKKDQKKVEKHNRVIFFKKKEGRKTKDKGEIFENGTNALSTILFLIFIGDFQALCLLCNQDVKNLGRV